MGGIRHYDRTYIDKDADKTSNDNSKVRTEFLKESRLLSNFFFLYTCAYIYWVVEKMHGHY